MIIHECEQGSEDWFRVRMGIPTASEFHTVMAVGVKGGESKTRRTYMMKLAGEILTDDPMDSYSNGHMERGKEMEGDARAHYAFVNDVEPELVGFITNGPKGCSPDSLIGTDGMLEIKTKLPHLLIDELIRDRFPPTHKDQCMGQLWVAERDWCDLAVYWPKLPLYVKRLYRDEEHIKALSEGVDRFNAELAELVETVRRYGSPAEAMKMAG